MSKGQKRNADEAFSSHAGSNSNGVKQHSLKQRASELIEARKNLPIWPHQDEIRRKVKDNDVVVLVGETGSGKSTQLPQFLYTESWCQRKSVRVTVRGPRLDGSKKDAAIIQSKPVGGMIGILQPRRVAAVSLAHRVAAEVGTPLGTSSPSSLVGYSVRFDNNVSISGSCKIKFLTDGMMLQELGRDPWLRDYSCVIVDEVHERGVNVDLTLGFLKQILKVQNDTTNGRGGIALKVVVMSATANMDLVKSFFQKQSPETNDNKSTPNRKDQDPSDISSSRVINLESCQIPGRQYPVRITYAPAPVTNLLDECMKTIIDIHTHQALPGDILVFLSGQEMIENLESLCTAYASTLDRQGHDTINGSGKVSQKSSKTPPVPRLEVLPLYASLSTAAQQRVFTPTREKFTRRVILATNIAETSITVPKVRHVIDSGKQKSRHFRPGLNLDTLLAGPVSRSAAKQRSGRAGREAAGSCHRLYTEADYLKLDADTQPEILQTDLSSLVLTLKSHGVDDVLKFPLLTPPPRRSLEAALCHLLNLDALDNETGKITAIGKAMARLPLRSDLARVLVATAEEPQGILDAVINIVAGLSLEEGVFLPLHGRKGQDSLPDVDIGGNGRSKKQSIGELMMVNGDLPKLDDDSDNSETAASPIEEARRRFLQRQSDHITLLNVIEAYIAPEVSDRREFCNQYAISHRALSRTMDVRKQLSGMMKRNGRPQMVDESVNSHASKSTVDKMLTHEQVLRCLCAGLWTNVAVLSSLQDDKSQAGSRNPGQQEQKAPYVTLLTRQPIYIHPSSTLFTHRSLVGSDLKQLPRAIVFTELVYTSKPYARNISAIDLSWISDLGRLG